jgi:hypothetical protein
MPQASCTPWAAPGAVGPPGSQHARPSDLPLLLLLFLRPLPAVYVGNLPWATSTEDLRQLFGAFGQVEVREPFGSCWAMISTSFLLQRQPHPVVSRYLQDAFIPQDRESGRPRGFAFVTMANGADQAIANLNETEFQVCADGLLIRACMSGWILQSLGAPWTALWYRIEP